jgi:enolase-phosphatase E1
VIDLSERGIRAVLLDIEGTTTPMAFVHEVLFPYARRFLERARVAVSGVHTARQPTPDGPDEIDEIDQLDADAIDRFLKLMDRDAKSPELKRLQGLIWERGYRAGELCGEVFPDVAPAIRRWKHAGRRVAIYSSGSALAQRLLFESTPEGDLTPLLDGFFDTAVGAKKEADSYLRIAAMLEVESRDVLFVSDISAELSAARQAGCDVVLSVRPGNADPPDDMTFEAVRTFDEIG